MTETPTTYTAPHTGAAAARIIVCCAHLRDLAQSLVDQRYLAGQTNSAGQYAALFGHSISVIEQLATGSDMRAGKQSYLVTLAMSGATEEELIAVAQEPTVGDLEEEMA